MKPQRFSLFVCCKKKKLFNCVTVDVLRFFVSIVKRIFRKRLWFIDVLLLFSLSIHVKDHSEDKLKRNCCWLAASCYRESDSSTWLYRWTMIFFFFHIFLLWYCAIQYLLLTWLHFTEHMNEIFVFRFVCYTVRLVTRMFSFCFHLFWKIQSRTLL